MDGRMDVWMDEWTDGWTNRWFDGMDGRKIAREEMKREILKPGSESTRTDRQKVDK